MQRKWIIAIPLILLLGLICAAILMISSVSINMLKSRGFHAFFDRSQLVSATVKETKTLPVGQAPSINVTNELGGITVQSGADSQVIVSIVKTGSAVTQAEADNIARSLKVDVTQQDGAVVVSAKAPDASHKVGDGGSQSVDLTITAPAGAQITAASDYGDVTMTGMQADASLTSKFSNVTVQDQNGGRLQVTAENGAISLENVNTGDQDVTLTSQNGEINVKNSSAGDIACSSDSGGISLEQIKAHGKIDLQSRYGTVALVNGVMNSLNVKSSSGDVSLSDLNLDAALQVENEYGAITLEQVKAAGYSLKTKNGPISLTTVGGPITASADFGDITIAHASQAVLTLTTQTGAIDFQGSLAAGVNTLASDSGGIHMTLPVNTALGIDLSSRTGVIESEFDVTLNGKPDEHHWVGALKSDEAKNADASLKVTSQNGDISLNINKP